MDEGAPLGNAARSKATAADQAMLATPQRDSAPDRKSSWAPPSADAALSAETMPIDVSTDAVEETAQFIERRLSVRLGERCERPDLIAAVIVTLFLKYMKRVMKAQGLA